MKYPEIKLGEVADIKGGKRLPKGEVLVDSDTGFPYIRAQDIKNGLITFKEPKFITSELRQKLKSYTVNKDDVCITIVGAYVGDVGIVPNSLSGANLTENAVKLTNLKNNFDAQYLKYCLLSREAQEAMKKFGSGAAQDKLGIYKIKEIQIPNPPAEIQRKIAAILSAYDDLIENNRKRIEILEEMARSLYREWFVNFRFPGHEQVKMVDSELALIPEGWEIVSFTDIADILSGGTPKTKIPEYWGGDIPFFTPKDASSSFYVTETDKSITELGLKKCNSKLYPKNTVFITARGTVGKAVLTAVDMAMNQSCFALKGREYINQYFIFLTVNAYAAHLKQTASGATFDAIIIDNFRRLIVVKPPLNLIGNFGTLIEPFFEKILNLLNKNANLHQTRDLLLPKLISGEIDVENFDINTGEIAA